METVSAGQVLEGKYRVVGTLGAGGMGTVFAAQDLETGRPVAIKMLSNVPARIVFHPDSGSFVLGDEVGFALRVRARMWRDEDFVPLKDDSLPGAELSIGRAHPNRVGDAAYLPGGERVLTVSGASPQTDDDVAVWDAATGALLGRVLRRPASYASIDVSPDGRRVLLADSSGAQAEVWSSAACEVE